MADLRYQRNIAARILKCGKDRIWLDPSRSADIAEAITARDINHLINDGVINKKHKKGVSTGRKRFAAAQKKKGRRKGPGSRKGKRSTRLPPKRAWIKQVRILRKTLSELKISGKIKKDVYRMLYRRVKGGFFRNREHLITYLEKEDIIKKGEVDVKKKKKS